MDKSTPIIVAEVIGKWLGGGVESVIMNYYRNIDRNKVQFDFIIDNDSICIPYDEIKELGGRVILVPPYQNTLKYYKELKKIFKINNYAIVHSHINTLSAFSLFAAKKAGIPVRIAHSHATTNKKELKRHILKLILRPFSKEFATHYMSCSEVAGRWQFGNKMYDTNKVTLLHNAIDLNKFNYNKEIRFKLRNQFNISKNTIVIGHVGRMVQTKNQNFIVDVFSDFHKIHNDSILVFVGQGPDLNIIKEKIKQLNLEDSTLILGQRNDINDIFQIFDFFILPSLYEGLGMTLIEAQVSGLKCFASTNVPIESKITDNVDFLNINEDSKVWANQLMKYINYDRISQIDNAKNAGYDISKEARCLVDYYLKLYSEVKYEKN